MPPTLKQLKEVEARINTALAEINRKRNEEDRKFIVAGIGKDLQPFFKALVENVKGAIVEAISQIKIDTPNVKIEPAQVNVPEIKVPKAEVEVKVNNPPIKIPPVKVPTPRVTVKVSPPKPPIVNVSPPKVTVKAPSVNFKEITQDNPLHVILTDSKGKKYKAMGSIMGGGSRGGGLVQIGGNTGIGTGIKTVAVAGTAEQITATNTPIKRVFIQALDTNTGIIVIGGVNVDATAATRKGIALYASQGQWFNIDNLKLIWLDSTVNGEKAHYLYEV